MTKTHPSITAYKQVCKILGVKPGTITNVTDKANATTVLVPNKIFDWQDIKKLAVAFGEDQPYQTYTYDNLYEQYTSEELSGSVDDSINYRVLYIPDKYNVEPDTVDNQRKLVGRVPSVLEAVCFWFALRKSGKTMNFDSTYIRHFNLEAKNMFGWGTLPDSRVGDGGEAYLSGSVAAYDGHGRFALGSDLNLAPTPLSSTSDLIENTEAIRELTATLRKVYRLE